MFTPGRRAALRTALLERAAADPRISGAAITGSAAVDREDRWSDIDLAFAVATADELPTVLADWTAHMSTAHAAVHHVDMRAGAWTYRVFLLPDTLQVDLAFVPAPEFRALAPSFRLVSGQANEARHSPPDEVGDLIGMAWLHALHVRPAMARGRFWQAEYMISGVRDHALALACLRHGLPSSHGRGIDFLPPDVTAPFAGALVRRLDERELRRAFDAAIAGLLAEMHLADRELAGRLHETVRRLTEF
jgi:hypothetical protein